MEITIQTIGLGVGFLIIILYFILYEATFGFKDNRLSWTKIEMRADFGIFPFIMLVFCIVSLGLLYLIFYILEDI